MFTTLLLIFCIANTPIESARILAVFPTPSISHQYVFRPITHELARRGHEVIVLTTDPAFPKGKAPPNLTEIDVHDISYENWEDMINRHTGDSKDILNNIIAMFHSMTETFEKQMQVPEFQRILKEEKNKFDIILSEAWVRSATVLGHVLNCSIIQISSFGSVPSQYEYFGAPNHYFLYPSAGRVRIYNLTLWEKIQELFKAVVLEWIVTTTEEYENVMLRRNFGEDIPDIQVLYRKVKMLFLNEHHILSDNHPVPPNIVYIGGIHQRQEKELPKDLQRYMDTSKNGVIYFSFGTNIKPNLLPQDKILIMAKVLASLPYDVLWKWDGSQEPIQSENIKFGKWFPQPDLLRHPKLKLFITQGGLQSTDEALNAGVPLIGVPLLGDQWYNVEKYVKFKFGLQLDIMTLTEEECRKTVLTILEDPSYKENAVKMSNLIKEHPVKPVDLSVWWIEHVIKYDGDHLWPPAARWSSVFQYYEGPLILTVLTIVLVFISIVVIVIVYVLRLIRKLRCKVKQS